MAHSCVTLAVFRSSRFRLTLIPFSPFQKSPPWRQWGNVISDMEGRLRARERAITSSRCTIKSLNPGRQQQQQRRRRQGEARKGHRTAAPRFPFVEGGHPVCRPHRTAPAQTRHLRRRQQASQPKGTPPTTQWGPDATRSRTDEQREQQPPPPRRAPVSHSLAPMCRSERFE